MKEEPILPPERLWQATTESAIHDRQLFEELAAYINALIQSNFEHLVRILYRMDVSEPKLKQLLREHPEEDAGKIIAGLMVERQHQKIQTRKLFRDSDTDETGEERW